MHTFIIGGSGAGKSSLAQRLAAAEDRQHIDLDPYAWADTPGQRRDTAAAAAAVRAAAAEQPAVIEGCYADLVAALIQPGDRLIWLDLPVERCVAHCRARPFEPHKWPSAAAQDAFLPKLLDFVRAYPTRDDDLGAAAHRTLFEGHTGPRQRLQAPPTPGCTDPGLRARWLASAADEARRTLSVQSPQQRDANLRHWLAGELARVDDVAFRERFASGCPIPGAVPADYAQRILDLPGFGPSLLGIRFLGGDTGRPFVDLLAWSALPRDWRPGMAAIGEAFALFSPRRVRVLLAEPPPIPAAADQHWVAGLRSDARDLPAPHVPVVVEAAGPEDAPAVALAYRSALAAAPQLAPHLSPATAADLEGCVAVSLRIGEVWAGLAAATPQQRWALQGHEVVEEILDGPFRGMGFGPHLQRALLDALPGDGAPVFGTIHADNAPSLATARRCGRAEVATWWFVPTGR